MPYIGSYVLAPSIHSLFYVTTALLKSDVSGTEKNKDPRVLDLQGRDLVHIEEKGSEYQKMFLNNIFI